MINIIFGQNEKNNYNLKKPHMNKTSKQDLEGFNIDSPSLIHQFKSLMQCSFLWFVQEGG